MTSSIASRRVANLLPYSLPACGSLASGEMTKKARTIMRGAANLSLRGAQR